MKKRLLSALIFLPPVFYAVEVGGPLFLFVICLVTLIGFYEFYKALEIDSRAVWVITIVETLLIYFLILVDAPYDISYGFQDLSRVFVVLIGTLFIFTVAVMATYILKYPRMELRILALVFLGQFYILLPLLAYTLLGVMDFGMSYFRWIVVAIAFLSDSTAMFSGILLGKKKFVPHISPAKTKAGFYGSLLGTGIFLMIFTLIYKYIVNLGSGWDAWGNAMALDFFVFLAIPVGIVGSLLSQLGDLVGSAIKRQAGIKDFGNIIPGHGGILDRLDSIIFTSIYIFILVVFLPVMKEVVNWVF